MSYYRSLAGALRGRRLPEHRVAELLDEVRELAAESGEPPERLFGAPSTYADQFPRGTARSAGRRIVVAGAVLALALLVGDLVLKSQGHPDVTGPFPGSIALAGFLLLGVVAGFLVDSRLPAGFTAPPRERVDGPAAPTRD